MSHYLVFINTMERHRSLRGIRYEAYAHKKILDQGLNGRAISLTLNGEGNATKTVVISGGLPTVSLANNDLGAPFQNAVRSALALDNGGYILPESSDFPVIDAMYVSSRERLSLQMKAGQSKPLSGTEANTIYSATGGCLVFIVPDESVIRKKLSYAGPDGGRAPRRSFSSQTCPSGRRPTRQGVTVYSSDTGPRKSKRIARGSEAVDRRCAKA